MRRVFDAFPDVLIDHDNQFFYEGLLDHKLILNRCNDCGTWHAEPLRALCDRCNSWNMGHREVSGTGTVYMITLLHQGPAIAGVRYEPALPLAVIELDEQKGLRVSGKLVGPGADMSSIGRRAQIIWPDAQVAPRLTFELMAGA